MKERNKYETGTPFNNLNRDDQERPNRNPHIKPDLTGTRQTCLSFSDVSFSYPGGERILSGFSAEILDGEIVCIIGASGCGKTTLLNLAGGFLFPDSGEVTDAAGRVRCPSRTRIVVFQDDAQLFPWLTVSANASFPDSDPLHASELLDMVGLRGAAAMYPSQLSGGMKQRTVIARALAGRPQMLLLDEPFTALDAPTRRGLQNLLLDLNAGLGVSMLFVTHDIREAVYLADRIIVMTPAGPDELNVKASLGAASETGRRDEFSDDFVALERRVFRLVE